MDSTTVSQNLRVSCGFVDGDTRVFSIKHPRSDLTASDIEMYSNFIAANNLLVGDKNSAPFGKISKAVRINQSKTVFDISQI